MASHTLYSKKFFPKIKKNWNESNQYTPIQSDSLKPYRYFCWPGTRASDSIDCLMIKISNNILLKNICCYQRFCYPK